MNKAQKKKGNQEQVALTFDEGLFGTVSKKFEASSCQRNDLTLPVFSVLLVRLDVLIRDCLDHMHEIVGFGDIGNQPLVLRFQQLEESPDGNVLERRVTTGEEAIQITMDSAIWIRPVVYKYRVIPNYYC